MTSATSKLEILPRFLRGPIRIFLQSLLPYPVVEFQRGEKTVSLTTYREDYVGREIATGNFYEADLLDEIEKHLGPGGTYVDAGSFIGNHSVFFGLLCKADRLICFEPNQESRRLLIRNLNKNGLATISDVRECALSDAAGVAESQVTAYGNRGANRIVSTTGGTVPVRRLDHEIDEPVRLIKIDVEGHGMRVLRGADRLIEKFRPMVVIELDPEPKSELDLWMTENQYHCVDAFGSPANYLLRPGESA